MTDLQTLKYTADHEWIALDGDIATIGITDYAAEQLGDIVFVTLPTVGESVSAGDACGELESTKSVSDIFTPVTGVVSAVNTTLDANPETINADPYGDGWLFELEVEGGADLDDLLDADGYAEHTGS
jgi:glycine cleavage system H protein